MGIDTKFSVQEILNRCFDKNEQRLYANNTGNSNPTPNVITKYKKQYIWNLVFDEVNDRLRTN